MWKNHRGIHPKYWLILAVIFWLVSVKYGCNYLKFCIPNRLINYISLGISGFCITLLISHGVLKSTALFKCVYGNGFCKYTASYYAFISREEKKKKLLTITQVRFKNPSLANHLASPYSHHKLDTRSWAVTSLPLDHEKITHWVLCRPNIWTMT